MASGFSDSVRASSSQLSVRELLQQPVSELLGVTQGAATALGSLGIDTIFDLGSSTIFAQASAALAALSSDLGTLPGDLVDEGLAVGAIPTLPVSALRSLTDGEAAALSAALDVATVRELALWPPRHLAHEMVSYAAGTNLDALAEETAEELRPRMGEYPTERVYYDTLVMLRTEPNANLTPLSQPLSLDTVNAPGVGFGAPAIGALATYSQSWFTQGITLGQMVHSLALAPGEATRIAIIDWSRKTRASALESVDEREQLDNSTSHARAASEVQNAVANEMQSGGSVATGWAKSKSKASGFAASIGGGIAGTIGGAVGALGFGGGGSKSSQESETSSVATSTSWSVGSRSVMAEMSQRVNDRTEQHATSVRNRRASAVREVSQTEHEEVSTRIVANYNHMHALTIQYYEVVQIYRVTVQLNRFVRVLFVPFEMLDFSTPNAKDLVTRFRTQLLGAALGPRVADLILDDRGRVELRGAIRVPSPFTVAGQLADVRLATTLMAARAIGPVGSATTGTNGSSDPVADPGSAPSSALIRRTIVRPGPVAEVLPGDAKLVSISFEDVGIERVRIDQPGIPAETNTFVVPPSTDQVDFVTDIPLRTIEGIHVARDPGTQSEGSMVIRYESEGRQSLAVVPLSLTDGTHMQKVAFFAADAADRRAELLAHLQANRDYYTRAVLENLDSATLVLLLAGVSWQGKPLVDQIEPNPVAVAGNYLVLRAPADEGDLSGLDATETWGDLLRSRGVDFTKQDARLVPIPTGGVFAEAVLGRSNSAEKLDITRFWNWQDSPIPFAPTEIAPVGTGSRGTAENLTPGQLGAPVLNLTAPTQLPDPVGLSAVLGAIASGSMFRDMSGLAGTQATAQAASAGTLTAATEAGRIASENFKAATNQATEMGKSAADMWKVMKSSDRGGSGKKSSGGISADGARINHGKDMDRRGVPSTSATPKVTESRPVFASSREETRPQVFSREMAYADESAAVSPDLLGASTTALGSPAGADGLAGFLGSVGGAIGDSIDALGSGLRWLLEHSFLATVVADAARGGVSLQGARLIPMRLHDNHVEFEQVEYNAWTNNSQHVYVNVPFFFKQYNDAIASGSSADDAFAMMRSLAVFTVRHEIHHVTQFAGNQSQPPTSYGSMIGFEVQAYGQDFTWAQTQTVRDFLVNDLGTDPAVVDAIRDAAKQARDDFQAMTSLTTEPSRKSAMVNKKFLPDTIRGAAGYVIADLYKTKAP